MSPHPDIKSISIPPRIHVEGPRKRKPCDMSSWCRIADVDGSTIAYLPSEEDAKLVVKWLKAEAANRSDGKEGE